MGVAKIFQTGGGGITLSHTEVLSKFSPEILSVVRLQKALQRRGVTGTPGPPGLAPGYGLVVFTVTVSQVSQVSHLTGS